MIRIALTAIVILIEAIAVAADAPPPGGGATITFQELLKIRDPFKVTISKQVELPTLSPLQIHPVEAYKMVGVLTGPQKLRAVLRDPDGKDHVVSEKAQIGLRNGIVTRIYNDKLVVIEKMTNILGMVESIDTELPLIVESRAGVPSVSSAPTPENEAVRPYPFGSNRGRGGNPGGGPGRGR